ncbi:MAG: hypothetical protein N2381_01845 [Armatimonadetes bacterium]|nr:hypothetical protein [Armatimonadota bacterium]MCX7776795.1 hypothetical protein [Armatimonadota bacterium]
MLALLCDENARANGLDKNQPSVCSLTFDEEPLGVLPTEWRAFGGDWRVAISGDEQVLQQSSTTLHGLSYAIFLPSNYSVSVRVRPNQVLSPFGMGIVSYWQDAQNHYRLLSYGNQFHLVRVSAGQVISLNWMPYAFEPMLWYRMKLSTINIGRRLSLYGKVWKDGEDEPKMWTLVGEDLSPVAMHGWAGLWCAKCACEFDDFEMSWGDQHGKSTIRLRDSFERYAVGQPPSTWIFDGGLWQIQNSDTSVLSQLRLLNEHRFEHNHYAVMAGWSSYTITVRVRALEGAEVYGIGLSANWRDARSHYDLLSIGGTRLALLAYAFGEQKPRMLAECHLTVERGRWHWFKLCVSDLGNATKLQAKVWRTDQKEAGDWQLEAIDDGKGRIASGTFGFVSLATSCEFDDLKVEFDSAR